jgi:hypothetical protein
VKSVKKNSKSKSDAAKKKRQIKKRLLSKRRSPISLLPIYTNQLSLQWKRRKAILMKSLIRKRMKKKSSRKK